MNNPHPLNNGSGPKRAWRAFTCSLKGMRAAFKHESAIRQETGLACIFLPLGLWLGESLTQKILLVSLVVLVFVVELLNSAIEATVDRIGEEYHELSGRAKDMGSAAVMLCLLLTAGAYAAVAIERFY